MIRRYEEKDISSVVELWNYHFTQSDIRKRKFIFQWVINKNPSKGKAGPYYLVTDGDCVIGYNGLMPHEFILHGEKVEGCIYHDTLIHPEKRGKGIGSTLVRTMMRENKQFSIAVWTNAANLRVYTKSGWTRVGGCRPRMRYYDLIRKHTNRSSIWGKLYLSPVSWLLKLFYNTIDLFMNCLMHNLNVEEIQRFDQRIDDLFLSAKKSFKFIGYRDSKTLNWKYCEHPFHRYQKLIVSEDGEIRGYIILRIHDAGNDRKQGLIVDFLCEPQRIDVFRKLLLAVIHSFSTSKVSSIHILNTSPAFDRALGCLGFIKAKENEGALMVFNHEKNAELSELIDAKNWFFTFGDGDRDFWAENA